MSPFLALLRRELAAYFHTPLALVYTVIFLMLSNSFVFYLGDLYETGQASMQAYFRLLPWVCLLLVPALSMRGWSEEFSSGTIELLDALPVPPWQQVLAKFGALWSVAVSALLLSFPLWLSLAWLGDPDHGTVMLGYIGTCLMLAAMLSIGLCASSFSENQLVVYLLSAMILLLYLLAGYPLALNPIREVFPQHVVDLIGSMSFLTHLNAITRGVLDLRDLLFFVITTLFWLALNLLVLRARKGGRMTLPISARLPLSILMLSCVYFVLCQLVLGLMPPKRLDLTEKKLFTLTEGSIHILRDIRTPVTLTLYYSEKEARPYPQFRQYATRVVEKAEEYAAQSDGKVMLRILDPEPYSVIEDAAIVDGISAIPLEDGSGPLYFGLTALSDGRKKTIGFVKPEAEEHLEYELSKLIRSVQRIEKPKVALVTELPVTGNSNPAFGPVTPAWVAFRQLSERYDMVTLSPRDLKIPEDVDVLWVMHPRGWSADSYRKIQDFINAGRHAVILLDPNAESVPVFGNTGELALGSDAASLFQPWGIVFDPGQVVLDSKYAWLMQLNENQFPKRNPGLISLPGAAMNQSDLVTTDLDRIVLSSTGALAIRDSSELKIEPLLQSSDASRLLDAVAYRSAANDPEKLLNKFVSSQEPFVLAARFTGKIAGSKSGTGSINFIVISDTDFLSDRLWVMESNLFGEPVYSAQASNGDFFFNVIDQLSGSDDLISIRSRGMVARPFEKVDQLRRTAEQRYRDSQIGLLADLEKVQGEINSLQAEAKAGSLMENPRRAGLDAKKINLRKQLRRIQRELNEDVESLGQRIKLLNIFGLPVLLLLIAGIIAIRRRMFKDYVRAPGHAAA